MFNEAINEKNVRKPYLDVMNWANSLPKNIITKKKIEAEELFKKIGITFSVYNNFDTSERLIPFDFFPRIITSLEWLKIEKGIKQRAIAINAFLNDIYHRGEIIKANIIPTKLIYNNPSYEEFTSVSFNTQFKLIIDLPYLQSKFPSILMLLL